MPSRPQRKAPPSRKAKASRKAARHQGISSATPVHEILEAHPETLKEFVAVDMACLGDESQHAMTVQAWALDHGLTLSRFMERLNKAAHIRHHARKGGTRRR